MGILPFYTATVYPLSFSEQKKWLEARNLFFKSKSYIDFKSELSMNNSVFNKLGKSQIFFFILVYI